MNKIIKEIKDLAIDQPWNHCIEIENGVYTSNPSLHKRDGTNLVKWSKLVSYIDNYDWKNKVVLDVGASDGFFTVEMARRGAIVYSIEINSNRLKKLNYVVDKLKIKDSVTILDENIYDIDFNKLPNFDLAICMGFLHRVPDFYSVMSKISEISTQIVYEWKAFMDYTYEKPILFFDGKSSDLNDNYVTCFFTPNFYTVLKISSNLGMNYFKTISKKRRSMVVVSSKKTNDFTVFKDNISIPFFNKIKNLLFRVLREFKYLIK